MNKFARFISAIAIALILLLSAGLSATPGGAVHGPARMASGMEAPSGPTPSTRVVTSYVPPAGADAGRASTYRYWDEMPAGAAILQVGDQQEILPAASDQVQVIVQMRGEPLALLMEREAPLGSEISADQAMQFDSYQASLMQAQTHMLSSLRTRGIAFSVERQYTYLVNAVALTIQQRDWNSLQSAPGVLAVHRNYTAHVSVQESVPMIGAPTVWNMFDAGGQHVTGKGMRIAIIDTGVDYTHPDLGGCYGSLCKVVDGYDFVNGDFIPMDDYGHGTHVAGIVAANGTIKGVAPDATLLAYKVCNAYGGCTYADIIAGLERAADPDQNPFSNDAVDVANLSLGGPGDPTDILSQAVDAATAKGIVVVVAAGNNGPDYETIGSPGAARTAITVAASDKTDAIAYFSSRGPIPGFYDDLKPDITAPGVDIYSTVTTDGFLGDPSRYARLNGTSMATPHVAGSAALLLQLHPTWTPSMVKSTLMNTAVDLGQSANLQGAGRLNVAKAATSPVMIAPASIGFGIDDLSQSTWTVNASITITNQSNALKSYSLASSGSFPAGSTLSLAPKNFNLNGGQSQVVSVSLSVNNAVVPNALNAPFTYEDNILVTSGAETWNVPLTFVKSPMATFVFDQAPWIFLVFNEMGFARSVIYPPTNLTLLMPEGSFDVIALYNPVDTMIVKEGVTVPAGAVTIPFNKTDAIHHVLVDSRDENDQPVFAQLGVETMTNKLNGIGLTLVHMGGFPTDRYLSGFSADYVWAWSSTISTNLRSYDFNGLVTNGLSSGMTFTNTPAELRHVVMKYSVPDSVTQASILHWVSQGPRGGFSTASYDYGTPLTAPFERDVYILPRADNSIYSLGYYYEDLVTPPFTQDNNQILTETPYLIARDINNLDAYAFGRSAPAWTTSGLIAPFNFSPPHWSGKFENDSTTVRLKTALGIWPYLYLNQSQDFSPHPALAYTLTSQNGSVVSQGELTVWDGQCVNEYLVSCVTWTVPSAGVYSLNVPSPKYFIGGMQGSAAARLDFNTSLADPNPPALYLLNLLEDGQQTESITPNVSNAALKFEVGDDESGLKSVSAQIMLNGAWQSLGLQSSNLPYGTAYTAALPPIPADSYVSMRIIASDNSNNSLTYTFWLSGLGVLSSTRMGTNPTGAASVDFKVTFTNEVTGVDISDFGLTTSGVSGATVSGVSGSGDTYTVSVNTGSGNGTLRLDVLDDGSIYDLAGRQLGGTGTENGAFSGGDSYTIAHVSPTPIAPANAQQLLHRRPEFDWSDFTGAGSYQIQVSKVGSFGSTVINKSLQVSSYELASDLLPNTLYYWRVRAKVGASYTPWSNVFTFTTGNPPSVPALTSPANNGLIYTPEVTLDWSDSSLPAGVTLDHYSLQVDDDPAFSSPMVDVDTLTSSHEVDSLASNIKLFWRVRAWGSNGHVSAWSAVGNFRRALDAPSLLSPLGGVTVSNLKPLFDWSDVVGATGYTIQVSLSNSFKTFAINVTLRTPVSQYVHGMNLQAGKLYYWRVRANGLNGPSAWSAVETFRTP